MRLASKRNISSSSLPKWVDESKSSWGNPVIVPEWEEYYHCNSKKNKDSEEKHQHNGMNNHDAKSEVEEYRSKHGWLGNDLCHDRYTSPVYVTHYHVIYPSSIVTDSSDTDTTTTALALPETTTDQTNKSGVGTILTGVAEFTPRSESHAGYCHGGSMCALMDDVIGWCGFLTTGKCLPWSGYTAQIDTSLKRPIPVGKHLQIRAEIVKRINRKVYIKAILIDPDISVSNKGNENVHATASGLFLLKKEIE